LRFHQTQRRDRQWREEKVYFYTGGIEAQIKFCEVRKTHCHLHDLAWNKDFKRIFLNGFEDGKQVIMEGI